MNWLDALRGVVRHRPDASSLAFRVAMEPIDALERGRQAYARRAWFLHIGGALNDRVEQDGAVGNRDARLALGVNGAWPPGDPQADAYRRWIRDAWEQTRPFSTGRTYINFQTADEDEQRVRASYGTNFDRLVDIKRRFDPGNLLRSNRNVRPPA